MRFSRESEHRHVGVAAGEMDVNKQPLDLQTVALMKIQ